MHPGVHSVGAGSARTEGGAICLTLCAGSLVLYAYFVCTAFVVNCVVLAAGHVAGNAVNSFMVLLFAHCNYLHHMMYVVLVFTAASFLFGGKHGTVRYRGHASVSFKR